MTCNSKQSNKENSEPNVGDALSATVAASLISSSPRKSQAQYALCKNRNTQYATSNLKNNITSTLLSAKSNNSPPSTPTRSERKFGPLNESHSRTPVKEPLNAGGSEAASWASPNPKVKAPHPYLKAKKASSQTHKETLKTPSTRASALELSQTSLASLLKKSASGFEIPKNMTHFFKKVPDKPSAEKVSLSGSSIFSPGFEHNNEESHLPQDSCSITTSSTETLVVENGNLEINQLKLSKLSLHSENSKFSSSANTTTDIDILSTSSISLTGCSPGGSLDELYYDFQDLEELDEELLDAVNFIISLPEKHELPPHPLFELASSSLVEDDAKDEDMDFMESQSSSPQYRFISPKNLQDRQKLTLVLDLDETLVHCSISQLDTYDFTFDLDIPGRSGSPLKVYVRWRPHLFTFLQKIKGRYEVIIFTASQKIYADTLLNLIDPNKETISHRLFRESCRWVNGNFIKDLDVLDRDLSRTIIVDNAPQAYGYHVSNGYPIVSWYDDPNDMALLHLLEFLDNEIHSVPDIRPVIRQRFPLYKTTLKHRELYYNTF